MEKFELYVRKPNGKLIPIWNGFGVYNKKTKTYGPYPLDKDGDLTAIRITATEDAINHQHLSYLSPSWNKRIKQLAIDFGASRYVNYPVVSNIPWRVLKTSSLLGPYEILRHLSKDFEWGPTHIKNLPKTGTTISAGDPIFTLADLATIRQSLKGTGIIVNAPHLHAFGAFQGKELNVDNWLTNGTKKHIDEIRTPIPAPAPEVTKQDELVFMKIKISALEGELSTTINDRNNVIKENEFLKNSLKNSDSMIAEQKIKIENQRIKLSALESKNKKMAKGSISELSIVTFIIGKIRSFISRNRTTV